MSSSGNKFIFENSNIAFPHANSIWLSLHRGITEIQNGNASQLRFEELYRNAYFLVLHKYGDFLYSNVKNTIKEDLDIIACKVASVNEQQLTSTVLSNQQHHKLIMSMIHDILMYMDRAYCETKLKTPVYKLGLQMFRDVVLLSTGISNRLTSQLLDMIGKERENQVIDRILLRNLLQMFVDCNASEPPDYSFYTQAFETRFLDESKVFYQSLSEALIKRYSTIEYLKKVDGLLSEETARCNFYLCSPTHSKVLKICDEILIEQYAKRLVENKSSGFKYMFSNSLFNDLSLMYKLFSRVPSTLKLLCDYFYNHLKILGMKIVQDADLIKNPKTLIEKLLELHRKYFRFVSESLSNNTSVVRRQKDAFETFINHDARVAQYLSIYVDDLIKRSLRETLQESQIEQCLSDIITLFQFLSDKDVFEEYYKQHLCSRLLLNKPVLDDIEKKMIGLLKAECGHQFTSKLEGMLKDIDLSRHFYDKWKGYQRKKLEPQTVDIEPIVLTKGYQPLPNIPECKLPNNVAKASEDFKAFYIESHRGKRLNYATSKGSAELTCQFSCGKRELIVHTYQMCILMLFNDRNQFTFSEILKLTNIPRQDLSNHCLSLAHPKIRILNKIPNTRRLEDSHTFAWNNNYTSKLFRIRVPLLVSGSASTVKTVSNGPSSSSKIPPGVMETRKNSVEASIVRIMKSRRTLNHNQLIAEVCKQLSSKFPPDPIFIKNRIEGLIERDYLERDPSDKTLYHYLA